MPWGRESRGGRCDKGGCGCIKNPVSPAGIRWPLEGGGLLGWDRVSIRRMEERSKNSSEKIAKCSSEQSFDIKSVYRLKERCC